MAKKAPVGPAIHKEKATGREYIAKPEPGMPVLRGVLKSRGTEIKVYCPYCNLAHHHGWKKEYSPRGLYHRIAHCAEKNPFRENGYYIGILRATDQ